MNRQCDHRSRFVFGFWRRANPKRCPRQASKVYRPKPGEYSSPGPFYFCVKHEPVGNGRTTRSIEAESLPCRCGTNAYCHPHKMPPSEQANDGGEA